MKRFILFSFMLTCCLMAKAYVFVYSWTDENGTTWKFTPSGELYAGINEPCISGNIPSDLVIPTTVYYEDIAYSVNSIGEYAFYGCSSLTSISIHEGVTSIGSRAFYRCSGLTSISIPGSVTSIETYAFGECTMSYMYFEGNTPCTLANSSSICLNAVLIVPDAAVEAYQTAWPDRSNIVVGQSDNTLKTFNITANASESALVAAVGEANTLKVTKLKLSGTINSYDMMAIRNKMINLRELDLEDASIVANDYQYYSGCSSQDNVFGDNFLRDTKIFSVVLPTTATSIGRDAFHGCSNLRSVTNLVGITSIVGGAFNGCSSLQSIDLPNSLSFIDGYTFYGCSKLTTITIPEGVTSINSYTFNGCSNLQSVRLSPQTTTINKNAFTSCSNLTEFRLPPYLQSIGDNAFGGCSHLKDIYAYMADVPTINTNTFNDYQHQILYVPEFLYKKYYYDTNWSQFLDVRICELQAGDYESFYANSDIVFEEGVERITEDDVEAELGDQGGITVEGEPQAFESIDQNSDGNGHCASLIGDGDTPATNNMPVGHLNVKIQVQANRWYFFCFPFDVTIADCEYPGKYAWREYNGATRATNGSGGWQAVTGGTTLLAQKGYIFQSSTAGKLVVKFTNPTFGGNRPVALEAHVSNNAANASWNLVGNPYSCYYDFDENDFTSPVTVWNGSSYEAFRPGDDDYHLQPYEAFFVQKPEAANQVGFVTDRRETYRQSETKKAHQAKRRSSQGINPQRRFINLSIGDNETEMMDKTRLVLNEDASRNYEMDCDAAKFLSDDAVAQLYTVEGKVPMSINERPSDGDIRLGYVAKKAGTLRIEASRMDLPMVLTDTQTNKTFDLSLGSYEFTTEAGTFNQRFMLRPSEEATGIQSLTTKTGVAIGVQDGGLNIGGAEGKNVGIYSANGALAAQQTGNGFVALSSGVYVVKVAGASAKVYVK